jgi:exopolysaccharide biosynthesis WecB/TagA/CpsF family protein
MKRCSCGQPRRRFSLYTICDSCLNKYLDELPYRTNFSVEEFQIERDHTTRVSTAVQVSPVAQRVRLLNTSIDPVTLGEAMTEIEHYVESGVPHQLITVNVDFVRIAQENEHFRRIVNNSDLSVADGKPLLWAARWTGQKLPARVTGMDLVLGCAELAVRRDERIFLLGAAEGVAPKAALALREMFPGLKVSTYSPPMGPFTDQENEYMVNLIRESGAKYLFVAFGAPKQDVWIAEHMHLMGVPVCAGIGGVLNFLAGCVKRAPEWVQQLGLEWLYRVAQEPLRLWRRYFLQDLPVFARMLMQPVVTPNPAMMQRQPSAGAASPIHAEYQPQFVGQERAVGNP